MSSPPDTASMDRQETEVVSARVFRAPRALVIQAFTDPAVLARWWGPEGFTSTFREFDLRPGGMWRFVMHGPDGTDYPMEQRFVEVALPDRIVLQHTHATHGFRMTMTFTDEGGGTRLTWRMRFDSAEEYARVGAFVQAANEQNFDRLEAQLVDDVHPSIIRGISPS